MRDWRVKKGWTPISIFLKKTKSKSKHKKIVLTDLDRKNPPTFYPDRVRKAPEIKDEG